MKPINRNTASITRCAIAFFLKSSIASHPPEPKKRLQNVPDKTFAAAPLEFTGTNIYPPAEARLPVVSSADIVVALEEEERSSPRGVPARLGPDGFFAPCPFFVVEQSIVLFNIRWHTTCCLSVCCSPALLLRRRYTP